MPRFFGYAVVLFLGQVEEFFGDRSDGLASLIKKEASFGVDVINIVVGIQVDVAILRCFDDQFSWALRSKRRR